MTTKELYERLGLAMEEIPALADKDVNIDIADNLFEPKELIVEDVLYDEDSVTIYDY